MKGNRIETKTKSKSKLTKYGDEIKNEIRRLIKCRETK